MPDQQKIDNKILLKLYRVLETNVDWDEHYLGLSQKARDEMLVRLKEILKEEGSDFSSPAGHLRTALRDYIEEHDPETFEKEVITPSAKADGFYRTFTEAL
jgi:hypothetical protein